MRKRFSTQKQKNNEYSEKHTLVKRINKYFSDDYKNFRKQKIFYLDLKVLPFAFIANYKKKTDSPFFLVLDNLQKADSLYNELIQWKLFFNKKINVCLLPEKLPESRNSKANFEFIKSLSRLMQGEDDIIVTSSSALLTPVPAKNSFTKKHINILRTLRISPFRLVENLIDIGYREVFQVHAPGEFSRRGGIIDIFSPIENYPARLEFFGDEIETLRTFDPESQISIKQLQSYLIFPVKLKITAESEKNILNYFDKKKAQVGLVNTAEIKNHAEQYLSESDTKKIEGIINNDTTILFEDTLNRNKTENSGNTKLKIFRSTETLSESFWNKRESSPASLYHKILTEQFFNWEKQGKKLYFTASSEDSLEHIKEWGEEHKYKIKNEKIIKTEIPYGINIPELNMVIISEKDIFFPFDRHPVSSTPPPERKNFNRVSAVEPANFEAGDFVVHALYGIGRFHGFSLHNHDGITEESFEIEFENNIKIFVPVLQAHLISRFIGAGRAYPKLAKVNSKTWKKKKEKAVKSIRKLALEMLKMEAVRKNSRGNKCRKDNLYQKIMENTFPYQETSDQIQALKEIKKDMCSRAPMDRLLCGDAGFGKTELAVRAAFKAVNNGSQVIMLAPTTVLVQQHFYTFSERLGEYPVIIEMLSRFKTPSEQKEILQKAAEGKVDIVIGTHKLLQKNIKFKNPGLLIIDEEQRFGVKHKESLKKLRSSVDILTMTATPIPRTLHMAISGIRQMSSITTAPQKRLSIETIVDKYSDELVIKTVKNEIQRGGQVFYLHNRVHSIDQKCIQLQSLMPEINFACAHGQMDEYELEEIMKNFIRGNIDVLVSTSIIESGIDIPNANTIIIERADRFGLAELYQLKGRVGRWKRQAYAYFLTPGFSSLAGDAKSRISAIAKHTELGAGLQLAIRDLEIRGAGSILGSEQSGHINSIGFHLYCQMLRNAVADLRDDTSIFIPELELSVDFIIYGPKSGKNKLACGIPQEYIESDAVRTDFYRKISSANSKSKITKIKKQIKDRFGKIPEQLKNLFELMEIKINLASLEYEKLTVKNSKILIEKNGKFLKINGKIPKLNETAPKKKLKQIKNISLNPEKQKKIMTKNQVEFEF